jgi:hypothetical protein
MGSASIWRTSSATALTGAALDLDIEGGPRLAVVCGGDGGAVEFE